VTFKRCVLAFKLRFDVALSRTYVAFVHVYDVSTQCIFVMYERQTTFLCGVRTLVSVVETPRMYVAYVRGVYTEHKVLVRTWRSNVENPTFLRGVLTWGTPCKFLFRCMRV
jgi:hypothetical protein